MGLGPGDPELLTIKAQNVLEKVDIIVLPDSGSSSVAREIIEGATVDHRARYEVVDMPMTKDPVELDRVHDEAYQTIATWLDAGESVAFVTLGDPSFYATWTPLQRRALADNREVITIPGVISPCALAAQMNVPLAERQERLTVVPAIDGKPLPHDNLIVMKVGPRFSRIAEDLASQGRLDQAVMGVRCGMEGEALYSNLATCPEPHSYFSTILAGPMREQKGETSN